MECLREAVQLLSSTQNPQIRCLSFAQILENTRQFFMRLSPCMLLVREKNLYKEMQPNLFSMWTFYRKVRNPYFHQHTLSIPSIWYKFQTKTRIQLHGTIENTNKDIDQENPFLLFPSTSAACSRDVWYRLILRLFDISTQ